MDATNVVHLPVEGTSASTASESNMGGYLRILTRRPVLIIGGAFAIASTSSAAPMLAEALKGSHASLGTNSGPAQPIADTPNGSLDPRSVPVANPVSELKRLSGLTWDEIAQLFEVSRRSVHFWASGQPLSASNEKRLLHALAVIRSADRGDARQNRAALFAPVRGVVPFDLLGAQRFQDALGVLGRGKGRARPSDVRLSQSEHDARKPLPPAVLLSAQEDAAHVELGRARPARVVRVARRTDS